jgi:hypothetical protein
MRTPLARNFNSDEAMVEFIRAAPAAPRTLEKSMMARN